MTTPTPIQQGPLVHTCRIKTTETCTALITDGMLRLAFGIPLRAKVTVGVPGGGDWSNTNLTLDETSSAGIEVVWTTEY
jgi:hypothetical protein